MTQTNYFSLFAMTMLLALTSCSSGGSSGNSTIDPNPNPNVPETKKIPINLSCGVASRVTDTGYDTNDAIGLFVVNNVSGASADLKQTGNHVDNMRFTYSGSWTPDSPIYWSDNTTKADFYVYYPYATISSLTAQPFTVKEDQSTEANYKASEFLWGKATSIAPTEQVVSITTNHLFCCAQIKVAAGNGFTTESLAASTVSVKLNGVKTGATVNLSTGEVSATGDAKTITPLKTDNGYKALVVPQSVTGTNLITINVDGKDYNLKKDFTFNAGKRDTFTVTVSKTSNGINVNVGAWEDDGTDNGGTAE
jgi:hypothetical protein